MKTGLVITTLISIGSIGFVAWRVQAIRSHEVVHESIVKDPSLSHPTGCEALVGLTERAFRIPGLSPESTLSILVLGSEATANEPWRLAKYSIPKTQRVLEGRNANARREQELLRDAFEKCRNNISRTTRSPIMLGVKQAMAELRAEGCKETSHCELFVDTDGEENVEPFVKRSLNAGGQMPTPTLNNRGIEVHFCGIGTTAGRLVEPSGRKIRNVLPRDPTREDRIQKVWRAIFVDPESVTFEPFCPEPSRVTNVTLQPASEPEMVGR